ncbi:fimbrial protein [Klebsiella aerogenes]|uniref:fimbrial protein n=1 Tax=Klebsiella aerogenes TaxID=548 RepID=UPI0019D189D9|nr:type 1 fimbrial protein [Klebsiella aerogenes]HEM8658663.1 type 1 fimbrial protein [Klebsiella aerogenes]
MRINIVILIACFLLLTQEGMAAQLSDSLQGEGRVNMQGSIIDTACAIAVESREQTIDMGITPLSEIIRDGHGRTKKFSIELVNCVLERAGKEDWKQFSVTFDGESDGGLFGVSGDASGIALQLIDSSGNVVVPGESLPLQNIIPGDLQLNYTMRLVANKNTLKSGDYFSSIRFKLDYF